MGKKLKALSAVSLNRIVWPPWDLFSVGVRLTAVSWEPIILACELYGLYGVAGFVSRWNGWWDVWFG